MTYYLSAHAKHACNTKNPPIPYEVALAVANGEGHEYPSVKPNDGLYYCDHCGEAQMRKDGTVEYEGRTYNITVVLNPCCGRCVGAWHDDHPSPLRPDQIANGQTSFVRPCDKCGMNIRYTAEMNTQEKIDAHTRKHKCDPFMLKHRKNKR